jgi:hypothetical protein
MSLSVGAVLSGKTRAIQDKGSHGNA